MSGKQSGQDKGFLVRMGVLLAILVLLGGTLWYDRGVVRPANEKKIKELESFFDKNYDGLKQDKVRQQVGFAPVFSETRDKFEVDCYRFGGALPFLPAQNLYVVFLDDVYSFHTGDGSKVTAQALAESSRPKRGTRTIDVSPEPAVPAAAGGAGPVSSPPGSRPGRPGSAPDSGNAEGNQEPAADQPAGGGSQEAGGEPSPGGDSAGEPASGGDDGNKNQGGDGGRP